MLFLLTIIQDTLGFTNHYSDQHALTTSTLPQPPLLENKVEFNKLIQVNRKMVEQPCKTNIILECKTLYYTSFNTMNHSP